MLCVMRGLSLRLLHRVSVATLCLFINATFLIVNLGTESLAESGDWQGNWERTVEAAKKEGRVVVLLLSGRVYRDAVRPFEQAYPEIRLDAIGARGREITPRIRAEREAGQYLWDVYLNASETGIQVFKRGGYLAPVRPGLILPEVLANDKWLGGFDSGWIDDDNRYLYGYVGTLSQAFFVNREVVPESQLNSVEQLVEPRWRGKIVIDDPRRTGTGSTHLGRLLMVLGERWVRQFLANDLAISENQRQQAEFVFRGRYPIAMALRPSMYLEFYKQGLEHVKPLAPESEAGHGLSMVRVAGMFDRAPHPNAAKIFLNWYLTRQAQQHFTDLTEENSRRLDVIGPPETAPNPQVKYRSINQEKYQHFVIKAIQISKAVLGDVR